MLCGPGGRVWAVMKYMYSTLHEKECVKQKFSFMSLHVARYKKKPSGLKSDFFSSEL